MEQKREYPYCKIADSEVYEIMGDCWGETFRHKNTQSKKQRVFWVLTEKYFNETGQKLTFEQVYLLSNQMRYKENLRYEDANFRFAVCGV